MMASNMLTSERRWTSTRKSGMTVLGKVPKPINLPSQKLENHGLDPNVEIVPKGALTWGTRPSLASPHAWGSSTLSSPRADGSIGSSIHANGRPLSGGSGTRPSTGSSERSSEPSAVSWGPSSRPSSASGVVPTSHALVAANRPRSAETRPNSSQLSRFAESSTDAWGSAGTSEKVAAEASKRSDFNLSSGDFPTLGSEKIDEQKLHGQSLKGLALETVLPSCMKRTSDSQLNSGCENPGLTVHGNFNSWSSDSSSHAGEDASSRTENWHKGNHNSQPLLDANMPARQFASWRGPPGHSPNVVWYGGHEAGGPYRPFGPRGNYLVDPYYPYVPGGTLPSTQAFSRPEAIPGGMHFNERESYRHMHPESYISHSQSGIPVRPGVYQGPVLYEGFHGPSRTGFDNSSDQDVSTMGMPGQYAFSNQHLPDNSRLQPWRFYTQPDGSAPVMTQQHMISDQANENQGQYKVLLKQHGNQEEEHTLTVWPTTQRGRSPCFSTPETDLVNCYKKEKTTYKQHIEDSLSEHSNDSVDLTNKNPSGILKSMGHNVMKKPDTMSSPSNEQMNTSLKKNVSLMEKVEGLNSKTRVVDAHFEGENFPSKEKMKSNQNSKNNADHFDNIGPTDFSFASNAPIFYPRNVGTTQLITSAKVTVHESVTQLKPSPHQLDELAIVPEKSKYSEDVRHSKSRNQKKIRNMKAGADHLYGKLRFGSYGADEMNDSPEGDSSVSASKSEYSLSILGSHASQGVYEDQDSQLVSKSISEQSPLVSVDDVQHAKLKEAARQRAVELQKKELERTAEQKVKALARLDELNRRTSASSKQNSRHAQPPCNDVLHKHDTISSNDAKSSAVVNETHGTLSCNFQAENKGNDESIGDPPISSFSQPSRTSGFSVQACPTDGEQAWSLGQETTPEINTGRASDLQDEVVLRRKQAAYRRRCSITDEHNPSERKTYSGNSGSTRSASVVIEDTSDGLGNVNCRDSSFHPSSNDNRGSKSKLCDTQIISPLLSSTLLEGVSGKRFMEHNETKPRVNLVGQVPERNPGETMGGQGSFDLNDAPNQEGSESCKVTSERASNNQKPHPHRRLTRNLQSDKANAKHPASDTVVWAPVKPVNKNGSSEKFDENCGSDVTNLPEGKNGQDMHNVAKARRAEMERYVPKPIAKELSLQGDFQHPSPPSSSASAVTCRDVSSSVVKTTMTSMNTEDTKQIRQGKPRTSWRQRNSFEHERSALDGNVSESSKCLEKASELQHSRSSDYLNAEGGNGALEETLMTPLNIVKNHGTSRQRRQQYKEHRVDRSNNAPTHIKAMQGEISEKREVQSLVPAESCERNHSRNENLSVGLGQVRSHWQPKSQVHPQPSLHGYKGSEQRAPDKPLPSQKTVKNLDDSDSVDQRKKVEADNAKIQDGYAERKVMADEGDHQESPEGRKLMKQPLKNENEPIGHHLTGVTEAASADGNIYQEYPGVHRRGYNRGHVGADATYGGSKKVHSTGDRRNVGQSIDMFQHNSFAVEEVVESNRGSYGARYGMQGRNHSRRGGPLYGPRRGPAVRANNAYDIGG